MFTFETFTMDAHISIPYQMILQKVFVNIFLMWFVTNLLCV